MDRAQGGPSGLPAPLEQEAPGDQWSCDGTRARSYPRHTALTVLLVANGHGPCPPDQSRVGLGDPSSDTAAPFPRARFCPLAALALSVSVALTYT